MQTVAAIAARLVRVLAKIFQNVVAEAFRGVAVFLHYLKPSAVPLPYRLLICFIQIGHFLALQQKSVDNNILR